MTNGDHSGLAVSACAMNGEIDIGSTLNIDILMTYTALMANLRSLYSDIECN